MQQTSTTLEIEEAGLSRTGAERNRVERVAETLATARNEGESLAEVAHDARNMVTALGLYCDLLEEPGVLAVPYLHYSHELRLVASASRRLVERLVALDSGWNPSTNTEALSGSGSGQWPVGTAAAQSAAWNGSQDPERRLEPNKTPKGRWELLPALPVANLTAELMANRNLLTALAGPSIVMTVDASGCTRPVRLTGEDLTRALVNLVKNAAEAMPKGGCIHIGVYERAAAAGAAACLRLIVEDDGPGIPEETIEKIFVSGYTTRGRSEQGNGWPLIHRGLGLAITRSIVEAAGGRISARNRTQGGACIEIELPLQKAGS